MTTFLVFYVVSMVIAITIALVLIKAFELLLRSMIKRKELESQMSEIERLVKSIMKNLDKLEENGV